MQRDLISLFMTLAAAAAATHEDYVNFKGGMAQRVKRIDYNQQQENDSGNAKDSFGRVVAQSRVKYVRSWH